MVDSEIPSKESRRPFNDLLAAGWGLLREPPVAPLESVGIGFLWTSRRREDAMGVALPYPWTLIRNGLVERGAISPKAHIYMVRGEVVSIGKTNERARLIVHVER